MASFLNADLPSSEEDDEDYAPELDPTAPPPEDKPAGGKKGAAGKRPRRGPAATKRGGARKAAGASGSGGQAGGEDGKEGEAGDGEEDGEGDGDGEEEEEEVEGGQEGGLQDIRAAARRAAKRKKVEALWRLMNGGKAEEPAGEGQAGPSGQAARGAGDAGTGAQPQLLHTLARADVSLAALCRRTAYLPPPPRKLGKQEADELWMRSLGLGQPKKAAPQKAAPTPAQAAAVADAILAAQRASAVAPGPHDRLPEPGPSGSGSGSGGTGGGQAEAEAAAAEAEARRSLAASALAAAKEAAGGGRSLLYGNKVMVTEVRRFAGKDLEVKVAVDKGSREAAKAAERAAAGGGGGRVSGLDAILEEMTKKKKVSVLDKSKMDWRDFKQTNTTVDEELEAYKKSNNQYLDRKSFLQRAELREFEKERDLRLGSDIRTRGRL